VIELCLAKSSGIVKKISAELIGRASVLLGADRRKARDAIDFVVGFSAIKKIEEYVDLALLFVHARSKGVLESVLPLLEKAVAID